MTNNNNNNNKENVMDQIVDPEIIRQEVDDLMSNLNKTNSKENTVNFKVIASSDVYYQDWEFGTQEEALAKCKELYFDTFTGDITINDQPWRPSQELIEEYNNINFGEPTKPGIVADVFYVKGLVKGKKVLVLHKHTFEMTIWSKAEAISRAVKLLPTSEEKITGIMIRSGDNKIVLNRIEGGWVQRPVPKGLIMVYKAS